MGSWPHNVPQPSVGGLAVLVAPMRCGVPQLLSPPLGQFSFCLSPPHHPCPGDGASQLPGQGRPVPCRRRLTPVVPRRGLPTDRYMWSDATGLQECTKASTKPPSLQWAWVSSGLGAGGGCRGGSTRTDPPVPQVSDWFVDFSVPGGADQEGWQYASDFPA